MKKEQSNFKRKTPIIIWCIRFCFFIVIYFFLKKWLDNVSSTLTGKIFFGGIITTSTIALVASFIHSKASLVFVVVATIAIPFTVFLLMDIIVLHGSWWELLIGIPMQIGIPLVIAFYLWKAPNVRNYYLPEQ